MFLLVQAVTGLITSEPWLVGGQSVKEQMPMGNQNQFGGINENQGSINPSNNNGNTTSNQTRGTVPSPNSFGGQGQRGRQMEQNSVLAMIKGIHQGNIGGVHLRYYIDILAMADFTDYNRNYVIDPSVASTSETQQETIRSGANF